VRATRIVSFVEEAASVVRTDHNRAAGILTTALRFIRGEVSSGMECSCIERMSRERREDT